MTEGRVGVTEGRVGMTEGRVGVTEGRVGVTEGRVGVAEGRVGVTERGAWVWRLCEGALVPLGLVDDVEELLAVQQAAGVFED